MKIFKWQSFLESTFINYYEDYFLWVYLAKKNVHKKAAAIPRIVEEKNLKLKAIFSQKKKNIMQMCLDARCRK